MFADCDVFLWFLSLIFCIREVFSRSFFRAIFVPPNAMIYSSCICIILVFLSLHMFYLLFCFLYSIVLNFNRYFIICCSVILYCSLNYYYSFIFSCSFIIGYSVILYCSLSFYCSLFSIILSFSTGLKSSIVFLFSIRHLFSIVLIV